MKKYFLIFLFLLWSAPALAKTYNLEIKKQNIFIAGKAVEAMTINDSIPGPTLRWQEGEDVVVNVKNSMDETTSIHWHGILLDGSMDGVPGLNGFHGIAPHTTFTYKFKIRQNGTYWYHSHSNLQEAQGVYGSIVIEPSESKADRDYVVVLSDFSFEHPNTILNNLKIDSGYYNFNKRTIFTFFSDIKKNGFSATFRDYWDWGQMRMDPTDLSDVTKYHFLVNGETNGGSSLPLSRGSEFLRSEAQQNDGGSSLPLSRGSEFLRSEAQQSDGGSYFIFKKGERIKLRFINASAMTIYDVSIQGLKMKFVEADGQPIKPVTADEFRIGVAETYDVIVEPKEDKAYTIFAESLDRTGYARGTLAPREGMSGEIPKMRPRAVLTMADMAMGGMNHSGRQEMSDEKMDMKMEGMDHSAMNHDMSGMDHSAMNHDMSGMDMAGINMNAIKSGWADRGTPKGNKALEYSDLISLHPQKDLREPTREIEFKFGGAMNRYIWTINGEKFPKPTHLKYGERVRLKFVNETMMAHPIHLHGMFMQLENGQSMKWLPNKHTVIVPPAQTVTLLLTADEAGQWAFHCHLLLHMASGMMTSITVYKND
jgi:FtsP/CotA-like multicopper oxidase with cupredoxin domain